MTEDGLAEVCDSQGVNIKCTDSQILKRRTTRTQISNRLHKPTNLDLIRRSETGLPLYAIFHFIEDKSGFKLF